MVLCSKLLTAQSERQRISSTEWNYEQEPVVGKKNQQKIGMTGKKDVKKTRSFDCDGH